jgi:hypothetical protein
VNNINAYYKNIDNCIDWYKSNTLFIEAYYGAMYYKEQNASATYDVCILNKGTFFAIITAVNRHDQRRGRPTRPVHRVVSADRLRSVVLGGDDL